MQLNIQQGRVALGIASAEHGAVMARGPYKKARNKPAPPRWRQTYLAEWRTLRGMTQEQLAARSGVSVGMISSMEAAKSGYSAESLYKLATALNIEPGMILSVDPNAGPSLWNLVSRATPVERDQIEKMAGVIVGAQPGRKR